MSVHATAIVDESAILGEGVEVGPFSYIGPDVEIGDYTKIESHVVIKGPTRIGKHNHIFQFASVGEGCQDLKFNWEPTRLEIGDHNIVREGCSIHRGTVTGNSVTRIGSHNLFMVNVHVAHDCVVGDHVVFATNVAVAGHVTIGHHVILGGCTAVHQFCNLGDHCFTGGGSIVLKDIPAYVIANGNSAKPFGINVAGLKRRGFSKEVIQSIRSAYKVVYRQGLTLEAALAKLHAIPDPCEEVALFAKSIQTSERGIIR